ncbi:M56 family metallopeptidase [Novipirellula sp. SH528]|uniref:M56 family metallopeptidase n=1 Tax=Novipirellula sp. SH528 TaxID=3454466 RepID=UPI003F9F4FAF
MNAPLLWEIVTGVCLQVTLVVVAAAIVERWLNQSESACRVWTASFVAVIALVANAILLPHFRIATIPVNRVTDRIELILQWQTWGMVVGVAIWLTGVLLILVRRGFGVFHLLRFLKRDCETVSLDQLELSGIPSDFIPPRLHLLVSEKLTGPFCRQFHQPTIVLPKYVIEGDKEVLRHVMLHELSHLKTNHPLQFFLQQICTAVLWFHPAIWWAGYRAEVVREFLCDEVAAKSAGKIVDYLRTLIQIAQRSVERPSCESPSCVLSFGRRKSVIVRRSERLVKLAKSPTVFSRPRQSLGYFGLAMMTLLAAHLWLPVNVLASSRSHWSPWPHWTASTLHDFGVNVRDFEPFDERHEFSESSHDDD